jgi:hypothetical protein
LRDVQKLLAQLESRPLDKQGLILKESIKAVAYDDFFFFSKHILDYKDLRWRTHREPVLVLESDAHRKLVVEPRGTFKSTLASVSYPIWRLMRNPNLTILLDSEVFTNSKNFLREIRAHLNSNQRLQWLWGPWTGPIDNNSEVTIAQRTQNRKEASITVGGIETVKVGQHYDIIIGDDYNSPKNSDTPEKCRKIIDHVRYNLNILNPRAMGPDGLPTGEYCFAMTRYAELDIAGWALTLLGEKHLAEGKLRASSRGIIVDDEIESLKLSV